ncbi:hypothetical protein DFH06DRAFT_1161180 [Mycena polygramma]|nr:hypothetical protein DFH06DRAFT_1161180 [Mycena polygramma]
MDLRRTRPLPALRAAVQSEREHHWQLTALHSIARLWDDGVVQPTDTRDVVDLGWCAQTGDGGPSTTWHGDDKGFGVFRSLERTSMLMERHRRAQYY